MERKQLIIMERKQLITFVCMLIRGIAPPSTLHRAETFTLGGAWKSRN